MSSLNLTSRIQTQEVYLDSQYASVNLTNGSNSDVYFFLNTPVVVGNDHDIVMRLENFVCPMSFYIVNTNNQTLIISGTIYTISEGNYNANTLKTELASLLADFSITYDSNTSKLTFTSDSTFSFDSGSTCFKLLGFEEGTTYTASINDDGTYSLTSSYVVNLAGSSLIYIDIPNISTHNVSSKSGGAFTTIMKSILVDVPYGGILSYTNNTNSAVVLGEKYISYFRVRLLDDSYNLIDLNGQYFIITLELFYYYNGKPSMFLGNLRDVAERQQEELKKSLGNT